MVLRDYLIYPPVLTEAIFGINTLFEFSVVAEIAEIAALDNQLSIGDLAESIEYKSNDINQCMCLDQDRSIRKATATDVAELRRLILIALPEPGSTEAHREEALSEAIEDPDAAFMSLNYISYDRY